MMDVRKACLWSLYLANWNNLLLLEYVWLKRKRRLNRRRWWVRPVNRVRDAQGFYSNLVRELLETDHEEFFTLFRMSPEQFRILVELLHPRLKKRSKRTPLPTDLRVAVTLLYIAQGDTAKLKHVEFRIGTSTVYKIIHETCREIWNVLQPLVLKNPSKEDWKTISNGFMISWQFPNCLGAIDGRHMRIQAPSNSGSNYFNYKQFFSMVMMAACDAQYKFTWVDVGQFGSISDGGVWANTDFVEDLSSGDVPLPDPSPLPGSEVPFPYVFVGDEAFPLTTYMMRPYPRKTLTDEKRIFNYRLSRARRVIENAFGNLTARWKILQRPLCMSPTNCENIFRALPCLHNFIMMAEEERNWNDREYCPRNMIDVETKDGTITDGEWRNYCISYFARLGRVGANRAGDIANGMRNYLRDYFVSSIGEEQAPWQYIHAFRGKDINFLE